MGRGVPAHVHAEAILSALQEARPAGLTITQLMSATERTRAQVHTGLAHLRKVAAARGLPPVTWDGKWGYRLLDDAPEVWIGYERAFFDTVHHRVENFNRRDPPAAPEEDPERPLHPHGHGADERDRVHLAAAGQPGVNPSTRGDGPRPPRSWPHPHVAARHRDAAPLPLPL